MTSLPRINILFHLFTPLKQETLVEKPDYFGKKQAVMMKMMMAQ
jgi:hypothetical protein